MSNKRVKDICLICKKQIKEGKAFYICKVDLTKKGRSAEGQGGASFGGSWQDVKDGELRIKYVPNGKPKGAIHSECLPSIIKI